MTRVAHPSVEFRVSGSTQQPHSPSRAVAWLGVEFGLPTAVYYGLRAGNVDIFRALLISAVIAVAVPVIRHQRLDGMATYVTAIMVGGVGISLLAGSTPFLLARGALLTGITGLWFIASLWARRPLAYLFSQPLLEGRFR